MNPNLDPIVARKLNDFRIRRINLILLKGLCSGVLSFLGTFILIALIDYISEAKMGNDLRIGLSFAAYIFVIFVVWGTCISPLLKLPNSKRLAQLMEQTSPDLEEDLLSAVELGTINQKMEDSFVFRQLVQKQASSKASKIDITSILPIGRLKNWLIGTLCLIITTLTLLQIPEFGSDLKLLMHRALIPGANLPPVTQFNVQILAPDENTTRTPSNEPLRFAVSIESKREGVSFEKVDLETRNKTETKIVGLAKRTGGVFFIDYNVDNQNFEYRVLVDLAPQTEWKKMEVRARPFIESYEKNFIFPPYSKLQPLKIVENHGDLEAWEGTEIELSMSLNQPVKSGTIEIQWTGKNSEVRKLIPTEKDNNLRSSFKMVCPGTYRVTNLIDKKLPWKGRPTPIFEISTKPDLAPSIKWIAPKVRSLLVAPNDLLNLSALAKDDLGLASVEYVIRKNHENWKSFPIPEMDNPNGLNSATIEFNLDLLTHKLKTGTQVFLKLQAIDLKGTKTETEVIQLFLISRDFDLAKIKLLEKKAEIKTSIDKIYEEATESHKSLQEITQNFNQKKINKDAFIEKALQTQAELSIEAENAYRFAIQSLFEMPRGTDSYEVSMYANAIGQIFLNSSKSFSNVIAAVDRETDINQISRLRNKTNSISINRRGKSGNLRNISQDLLNLHAETIAISYLDSMHQRQIELRKDLNNKKSISFLSRKQEVALSQWDPISNALSYSTDWSRGSVLKRTKTLQLKLLASLDKTDGDRNELKKQIEEWEKNSKQILHDTENKLASKFRQSIQKKQTEQLYRNLTRNDLLWSDADKLCKFMQKSKTEDLEFNIFDLLGQIDVLISDAMIMSEVEQAKKDQNTLFVKDSGQTGRALIQIQQEIRASDFNGSKSWSVLSRKSEELGSAFQILLLQHQLIGSANQVIYFMRQENGKFSNWVGAECARQWNRVEAVWKPILEIMHRENISAEAKDIMKRLPNQNYTKILGREMQKRSVSINHIQQSIDKEAELVFNDLQQIISIIKGEVVSARTFVNENAPSLPELARELARETEEQKNKIKDINEDNLSSFLEKRETIEKLRNQQVKIGKSVENFVQALRQEANIQNLLDEEGREIARDSDDAAALVQQREDVIEDNLQKTASTQSIKELREASEETIQEQKSLIKELNLIAEHFDRLNDQKPAKETRKELRDFEKDLEIADTLDKQYQQAEKLADLAKLSPKKLLEELEGELKQNQIMQRELSDITLDTLEQAKEQLVEAKNKEDALLDQIENEDRELIEKKEELFQRLKDLAGESQKLVQQKINPLGEKAEQAMRKSISDETNTLSVSLQELAKDTQVAVNEKLNTQELKEVARDLADILANSSEDLAEVAKDLDKQSKLSAPQAQQLADQMNKIAENKKKFADSLHENAVKNKAMAQQAKEKAFEKKTKRIVAEKAAKKKQQQANEAKKLADKSPEDIALKENQLKAEEQLNQKLDDLKEAGELSTLAEDRSANLNDIAETAQISAEQATKIAEETQMKAQEAIKLADALHDDRIQKSVSEAGIHGAKTAREASKEAKTLQEEVEAVAEALNQLTESAEARPELLAEAVKSQVELAEKTFETSLELAKAARHEQRLENMESSEKLNRLADSSEETALFELPKTAQALENQALLNQLEDLANATQELAKKLNGSKPTGDEGIAKELIQEAKEISELLNNDPSFTDLKEQTRELNKLAQTTKNKLGEQAGNLAAKANEAKQVANKATQVAAEAAEEMAQANKKADSVAQKSKGSEVEAFESTKKQGDTDASPDEVDQFTKAGDEATQNFTQAKELAENEKLAAKNAAEDATQAFQQAELAANLAKVSEELLETFSKPPTFAQFVDTELPHGGTALNNTENSFAEQLGIIESFQADEAQPSDKILNESIPQESNHADPLPFNTGDFENLESVLESTDSFSDPEVSQVLAQVLDGLDQAVFASANPFSDPTKIFSTESFSSPMKVQADESTEISDSKTNLPATDQPKSGNDSGGGSGALATASSQGNYENASALQSLQQATQAHAQAMAQQRSTIIRNLNAKGSQQNTTEGQFLPASLAEIGKLPQIEDKTKGDDWGNLPPRLAKDLMEAKREKVSENYRPQVQAYFEAMSKKARTTKK